MKRFLVFGGESYYPSGGWGDFQGDFDTIEEAKAVAKVLTTAHPFSGSHCDWVQIVDSHTKTIIE